MSPKLSWVLGLAWAVVAVMTQAADTAAMGVSATVLSKSNCKFPNGSIALAFGAIDPSSSSSAIASTSTTFTCGGTAATATFLITQNGGLNNAGGNRLQHATVPSAFLPYLLTMTPTTGAVAKSTAQTVTITGTIAPADFKQAVAGNYADIVILTIAP
ncbi:MAG TPA: spore coat protein U domain-containing protein [Usitatibacteraceae bacterium]